jgi:uncharacterized protein YjbI with pentapeptide repeats
MIGLFTVVTFFQQQTIEDRRRAQDQQIAELTRMKDIELANLTRMQDLQFEEKRREQDDQHVDELHWQGVYKNYIEDIANVVFKKLQQQDCSYPSLSVVDNRMRLAYIRSKTLTTLRELNWEHKTRLFIFLFENCLLPTINSSSPNSLSLGLSGADFVSIILRSSKSKRFIFHNLLLSTLDLTNASFIDCSFKDGVSFIGSDMSGVKFSGSSFQCQIDFDTYKNPTEILFYFDNAQLANADFQKAQLCGISFNQTNLAYSNFRNVTFSGKIDFIGTSLEYANFENVDHVPVYWRMTLLNVNMTGARHINHFLEWNDNINDETMQINNVILPNGTWVVNKSNLIRNGNAETEVRSCVLFI